MFSDAQPARRPVKIAVANAIQAANVAGKLALTAVAYREPAG